MVKSVYGYCPTCGYTATLSQYSTGRTVHLACRTVIVESVKSRIGQAHLRLPTGYCVCGRTPVLTPAEHTEHLTAVSTS